MDVSDGDRKPGARYLRSHPVGGVNLPVDEVHGTPGSNSRLARTPRDAYAP
jgi:hypothetical protein